jgi:hypothetical protein
MLTLTAETHVRSQAIPCGICGQSFKFYSIGIFSMLYGLKQLTSFIPQNMPPSPLLPPDLDVTPGASLDTTAERHVTALLLEINQLTPATIPKVSLWLLYYGSTNGMFEIFFPQKIVKNHKINYSAL